MTLLIFLAFAILLTIGISFYIYHIAFYAAPDKHCNIDDPLHGEQFEAVSDHIYRVGHIMEKYHCEKITIRSEDGYSLHGRYYHVQDGAPLQILIHGYRSCAFRDCGGGHSLSQRMGFNSLVIDQRAHGESGGRTISFGICEHKDCVSWISYCTARFGSDIPIVLWGISMGAATVLMALHRTLPPNVAAVIADSPYSSPKGIIEKVCSDLHYPVKLFRPFIHLSAWLFGRFRLNSISAKEAVAHSRIPILLIHGEDDRLVPFSMSIEIANCCTSAVTGEIFPDAGHALSYLTDPLRYEKVIYDFLKTVPTVAEWIPENFIQQNNKM